VLEDVAELVRVVGREDDLFLAKARLDTGVEEIGEFQIVRDPHDRDPGPVEFRVHPREVIEGVVPALLDKLVDLVEHDNNHALVVVDCLEEGRVDPVGGPASHGDLLHLFGIGFELVDSRVEVVERCELGVGEGGWSVGGGRAEFATPLQLVRDDRLVLLDKGVRELREDAVLRVRHLAVNVLDLAGYVVFL